MSAARERLLARIRKVRDKRTGEVHWLWTGAMQTTGYGNTRYPGEPHPITAHRAFYLEFVGPLKPDEDAHHTCTLNAGTIERARFLRRCCNPEHLTKAKATLNRSGKRAWRWRKPDGIWPAEGPAAAAGIW